MSTVSTLSYFFSTYLPFLTGAAGLVIGIIITAGKTKSTKILGIDYIVLFTCAWYSAASTIVSRYVGVKTYAVFSSGSSVLTAVSGIVSVICISIFLHRNYGKKYIYYPLLGLHLTGIIANVAVTFCLNSAKGITGVKKAVWIVLTRNINSAVVAAAISVIVIVILFRNRKNEKVVPSLWKFILITSAYSLFGNIVLAITYASMLAKDMWYGSSVNSAIMLITNFSSVVSLSTPIYVMIRSFTAAKPAEQ